jgi:hypothetical protein
MVVRFFDPLGPIPSLQFPHILLLPEEQVLFSIFERYWDEPYALSRRGHRASPKEYNEDWQSVYSRFHYHHSSTASMISR